MLPILKSWDQEYSKLLKNGLQHSIERRHFFQKIAAISAMGVVAPTMMAKELDKPQALKSLQQEPWLTIASVHEHMFPVTADKGSPSGKSPGAKEINATLYLIFAINTPDTKEKEREFIKSGVKWLNAFSEAKKKSAFSQLAAQDKEWVLRSIEKSNAGGRWLSSIMNYLFQALLADPVYGGNPNGIGWKWLQHSPGFPRPPANKRYYNLS